MRLYYRGDIVIATHSDDQILDPSAYGSDILVMTVPNDTLLERKGTLPENTTGNTVVDTRPFKVPQVVSAPLTKDQTKSEVVGIINAFADKYTSKYPTSEMLSWGTKDLAARTFLAGETISESQTILLNTEKAAGNYDSLEDLCQVIVTNSDIFIKISGFIAGLRAAAFTDIDKATNNQELKAIVEGVNKKIKETFNNS